MRIIILGTIILWMASGCTQSPEAVRVCFSNTPCIQVEVVDTVSARELGLMHRKRLDEQRGMLFVFQEEGRHDFWMKNMHFPLDIIWLGKDKVVVDIEENVLPCTDACPSLVPQGTSLYTLEVVSGFVARHRIKAGDAVSFTLP